MEYVLIDSGFTNILLSNIFRTHSAIVVGFGVFELVKMSMMAIGVFGGGPALL